LPLINSNISSSIKEDLLYNLGSNPFTLVLKNALEIFIEMDKHTIPFVIILAGAIASTWLVLEPQMNCQPAFLWNISSGARSLFMLNKIAITKKYNQLKKYLI
jgi:hypothetical protein